MGRRSALDRFSYVCGASTDGIARESEIFLLGLWVSQNDRVSLKRLRTFGFRDPHPPPSQMRNGGLLSRHRITTAGLRLFRKHPSPAMLLVGLGSLPPLSRLPTEQRRDRVQTLQTHTQRQEAEQ
eukprot:660673-Rhodomonas_salina.2